MPALGSHANTNSAPATSSADLPDPRATARHAGLRYVSDHKPGISRRNSGKTVRYLDPAGNPIRDQATLSRIKSVVIPPAWTNVWICPFENGHIQATGRDSRGRKQYRYHPRWRSVRDESKYGRTLAFAHALAAIRRKTKRDLQQPGLSREKVLAAVINLLETTLIRVGNTQYARQNQSFGLTTLRDRHVKVKGSKLTFQFRGKSGVNHDIALHDRRISQVIKRCQELPGQELIQYLDETGEPRDVTSDDVNDYLRSITGDDFTAKDFRTWAGTVLAVLALQEFEAFDTKVQAKKNLLRAIESVARKLGNTPSVCRKCYIHPAVLDSYLEGTMLEALQGRAQAEMARVRGLSAEESAVLALLQRRLAQEEKHDDQKRLETGSSARRRSPRQGRSQAHARRA
jgi:DNA topoisomerase-1